MDNLDWHERFSIQAGWTRQLRKYLYQHLGICCDSRVLEIGCGTGVITGEISQMINTPPFGIDVLFERLVFANQQDETTSFACADANYLPIQSESLDFVIGHFILLWLKDPLPALKEALRVLRPSGKIVLLAEPDHLARIDAPQSLWKLGELQTRSLINQGANPMAGRMLPELLSKAGFTSIQFGISGFQNQAASVPEWFESEWKTLRDDLHGLVAQQELDDFHTLDLDAYRNGSRVLCIPTFYAYGIKHY